MILDFANIRVKSKQLIDEISALADAVSNGSAPRSVSAESIVALNAVRGIGNIGAHMEADVNLIIDVNSEEAQALIDLIESLLDGWYVERNRQQQIFAKVAEIGNAKATEIAKGRATRVKAETIAIEPSLAIEPEVEG
jgi:hypothetical protein